MIFFFYFYCTTNYTTLHAERCGCELKRKRTLLQHVLGRKKSYYVTFFPPRKALANFHRVVFFFFQNNIYDFYSFKKKSKSTKLNKEKYYDVLILFVLSPQCFSANILSNVIDNTIKYDRKNS